MSPRPIVVIGAGVLGLSTAVRLQETYPKEEVAIIAAELPTDSSPTVDYASMWAGAHYRAIPASTPQLENEAELAMATFQTMLRIAAESPEAGVAPMKGVEHYETVTNEIGALRTGDRYAGPDDHFRVLDQMELPKGAEWGCEYESYGVNVNVYCRWLLRQFQARGGRVAQHKLASAASAFDLATKLDMGEAKCVVNCSGRNFDQDASMKIIRGQTVLVKQQYDKTITRHCADGRRPALIPRPLGGGTIVGVTLEIDDFHTAVREESRRALLEDAVEFFPDFVKNVEDFVVVKDNVGRRPWREGGVRIAAETIGGGRTIVHGYGAGGRGYELSWGIAERIVDLVSSRLGLDASG
ncbi:hypothetical protein DV738_g1174, partial [Chaetothyriales sp. CBS 135597]